MENEVKLTKLAKCAGCGAKRKKNPMIKAFITVAVIYFAIIVVYRAYHAAIHRAFF